ncbi:MAG: hydrogenase maturation protease [Candidatus Limnocylindrales bacterium]
MADQRFSPLPGDPRPQASALRPHTIVVGLGNPVLGDDGVGWRVADEVERRLAAGPSGGPGSDVQIQRLGVGGLRLMECLTGYETAILVDAAEFPDGPIGEVRACLFEDLADYAAGHLDSAHDASLRTALALGRRLGADLPAIIHAVTVQARRTDEFSEELSPEVAAAVPGAAEAVLAIIEAASGPIGAQRTEPAPPMARPPGP